MNKVFPWQTSIWAFLLERYQKDRLVHAFLFEGAEGVGKTSFAYLFAKLLLCQRKELNEACGRCRSCELFSAASHPDLISIVGEGKNETIKIDQIRELIASVNKTAHFYGYRVVIIEAAHQMNQAASNALLKTLEEPPSRVIFILLTDSLHRISATIRSRCEKINFPKPSFNQVKTWIEPQLPDQSAQQYSTQFLFNLAQDRPLVALDLAEDDNLMWREEIITDFSGVILKKLNPLGLAEKYQTLELDQLFFWLKTIVVDLIRLKINGSVRLLHADQIDKLRMIVTGLSVTNLYTYLDKLYALSDQIARGMNLNPTLVVNEVFCGIVD